MAIVTQLMGVSFPRGASNDASPGDAKSMTTMSLWVNLGVIYDETVAARFLDADIAVVTWGSPILERKRLKSIAQRLSPELPDAGLRHTRLTINVNGRPCVFNGADWASQGPFDSFDVL